MKYTCPMHPEVQQDHPGMCPICGMKLVERTSAVRNTPRQFSWNNYLPLVLVVACIAFISLFFSVRDAGLGVFSLTKSISYFMSGFFIVFSLFKLIDLKGFAQGYATYDLLAKKIFAYGYLYPFIELFFGIAMITNFQTKIILILEIIVMTFSGIGVTIKLLKREPFQCACLGTFLKVPLTKVTLVEDFGMALLAIILLFTS